MKSILNLTPCNTVDVEQAYIITLKNHNISEMLSRRCQSSCEQVNMPYQIWDAVDGTGNEIIIPDRLKDQSWIKWIKLYDTFLSQSEVACYISHISLWAHCIEINRPIVILEHDSVMVKPYRVHYGINQIVYLGCAEQTKGWNVTPIPPHGSLNPHYRFMLRAHAYAIDPLSAKNLIAHTLKYGINESLDVTIRSDVFGIIQAGFYAYDIPYKETTISNRKKNPFGGER